MVLPSGTQLNCDLVKQAIDVVTKKNDNLPPTYVIVAIEIWHDLKHEQILNEGSHSAWPYAEDLVINGIKVLSSKDVKDNELEIVASFSMELIFSGLFL